MSELTFAQYEESAQALRRRLGNFQPEVLLILGSGLGFLADEVRDSMAIPYAQIPHFGTSTAPGHKGRLVFGALADRQVAVMQGRLHTYEGYSMEQVSLAVRVARLLGPSVWWSPTPPAPSTLTTTPESSCSSPTTSSSSAPGP